MFKEDHLSFRQRKYMKVKNIIGRALGGIGLVVLSPVYLAIIVAIKKEDGITAPVFFSQKRVGIHKEYFNLYKFRSMRTDTPHDKPTHLLENPDQYITKVGRFLRKSSLDELPQLWNIARGDMAVIGPRPALWNQDDLIAERDKYGANDVKPGLTGWAQINGRDELEIPVKARLDGEYVKKMGPLMDIRCFIGTVFSVLRSDGVVEGGTGAKKKLMVITNHSYMLWQFRRELIGKLMEDYDVIISTPFVGHEDDFKAMGCTMIETDVDRRGINPKTDMKLYLTYRRLLKEHHPDMVVTYSIKPNVYAGYACRQMRIPYCVNVQGLGTAFQKNGLHDDNHYTCARDMALIGREIWRYPEFLKICQEQSYKIPASDTTEEHVFPQHHKMLIKENKNYYQYVVAGKTGYTSNALSTLITLADNGNMKLVCVVLRTHGVNIYPDTKNLFEYAFNNFQKIQVADEKKPDEVEKFISAADSQSAVSAQSDGSEDTESVQTGGNEYQPLEDGYVILPKDVSYKDIDYEITDVDEDTGEGTIRYIYDDHQVGSATAEFTDKYLQKVSTGKERVNSKPKDVDNSGDSKKNGGKSSAKSIWKNFLQKVKAVWDFGQKKFAGKSSTEKYMIAGGCVALVILIFSLIVLLIRRRR